MTMEKSLAICNLAAFVLIFRAGQTFAGDPSISLDASARVIPVGYTVEQAILYYPDGLGGDRPPQHLGGSSARWTSDNPEIVSVQRLSGQMTGNDRGTATLTATYQGLKASGQVKVAGALDYESIATEDGRSRSYLLYTPDGLSSQSHPLVLAFHGGGGKGENLMNDSQLNSAADAHGFLVAYPDGVGNTWNGGACCGRAAALHVDDVGFASQLIDRLAADRSVDAEQVFATGLSNGAILSHRLACELSDKIAAIAPVSGGLNVGGDFEACAPSRPVPIIEFHGTTDDNYPYLGGYGPDSAEDNYKYPIPASVVPSTISDWISIYGIDAERSQTVYRNGIETCERYSPSLGVPLILCTAEPSVRRKSEAVVWDGGGHAWPGGIWSANPDADLPTQDINASDEMAQFFLTIQKEKALVRRIVDDVLIRRAVRDAVIRRAVEVAWIREAVREAAAEKIIRDVVIREAIQEAILRRAVKTAIFREAARRAYLMEMIIDALVRDAIQDALVRQYILSRIG